MVTTSMPCSSHRGVEAVVRHRRDGHAVDRESVRRSAGARPPGRSARRRRRPRRCGRRPARGRRRRRRRSRRRDRRRVTAWAAGTMCVDPQPLVDVAPVGLHVPGAVHDGRRGARRSPGRRAWVAPLAQSRTTSKPAEVQAAEPLLQGRAGSPRRCRRSAPDPTRRGARAPAARSRAVSMAASAASVSFWPSGPKNLIPLSRYGLWEAEMTTAQVEPVAVQQQRRRRGGEHAAEQRVTAGRGDARARGRPRASRPTRACHGSRAPAAPRAERTRRWRPGPARARVRPSAGHRRVRGRRRCRRACGGQTPLLALARTAGAYGPSSGRPSCAPWRARRASGSRGA